MSTNNWGECPTCAGTVKKKLTEAYGKVSIAEYEKLQKALAEEVPANTLREDYEIGIHNGMFSVRYCAVCQCPRSWESGTGCGFLFEFTHKAPVMK